MPRTRPAHNLRLRFESLESRIALSLSGNGLFPADNPWNQKINAAPVAANSTLLVNTMGAAAPVHPDFGTIYAGALIGIPKNVVTAAQAKIDVVIDAYADESDIIAAPIPANAVLEGDPLPSGDNDGDRHLILYDKDNNIVYEFFNTHRPSEMPDNRWHADSEAAWDLNKNSFRTLGDTSADAAGLPILPGLVGPDEVFDQGVITHALRFTAPQTRDTWIFPASHEAGSNNAAYPRMGERFRLKQTFNISGFSAANKVILQALKDYGMILADNGSRWYISGEPSSRWNDDDLHNLAQVHGSDFEVVDLTPSVAALDRTSGATSGGTPVTITGLSFDGGAGQTQVFFGVTPATALTIVSNTQIVAIAPPHTAGVVDVTVRTPYGTSTIIAADRFTYAAPTVYQVTTTDDDVAGSLRQAIVAANGAPGVPHKILFQFPGAGVRTIQLASQLPSLNDPVVFEVGAGVTIEIGVASNLTLGEFPSLTKIGSGNLTIGGSQVHNSATTVVTYDGGLTLASDSGANLALYVAATGTVTFTSSQHLAALTIGSGATAKIAKNGSRVLSVASLNINTTGKLDLTDNDLVVRATAATSATVYDTLRDRIAAGYGATSSHWLGSGLTSSAAAADATHRTALGLLRNANALNQPIYTTFSGESVNSSSILVKYTYVGDANLSGAIDGTDYALVDNGFNYSLSGWRYGDFNFDRATNGTDYALIDNAFSFQGGPLTAQAVPIDLLLGLTLNDTNEFTAALSLHKATAPYRDFVRPSDATAKTIGSEQQFPPAYVRLDDDIDLQDAHLDDDLLSLLAALVASL